MNKTILPSVTVSIPPSLADELRALLGKPPVLASENIKDYEDLFSRIVGEINPKSFITLMMVRDYINVNWEIRRHRRFKAGLINSARKEALAALLESIGYASDRGAAVEAADQFYKSTDKNVEIDKVLSGHGIGEDEIDAQAFVLRAREYAQNEQILIELSAQRSELWTEIVCLMEGFDKRRIAPEIIDAEVLEVNTGDKDA